MLAGLVNFHVVAAPITGGIIALAGIRRGAGAAGLVFQAVQHIVVEFLAVHALAGGCYVDVDGAAAGGLKGSGLAGNAVLADQIGNIVAQNFLVHFYALTVCAGTEETAESSAVNGDSGGASTVRREGVSQLHVQTGVGILQSGFQGFAVRFDLCLLSKLSHVQRQLGRQGDYGSLYLLHHLVSVYRCTRLIGNDGEQLLVFVIFQIGVLCCVGIFSGGKSRIFPLRCLRRSGTGGGISLSSSFCGSSCAAEVCCDLIFQRSKIQSIEVFHCKCCLSGILFLLCQQGGKVGLLVIGELQFCPGDTVDFFSHGESESVGVRRLGQCLFCLLCSQAGDILSVDGGACGELCILVYGGMARISFGEHGDQDDRQHNNNDRASGDDCCKLFLCHSSCPPCRSLRHSIIMYTLAPIIRDRRGKSKGLMKF